MCSSLEESIVSGGKVTSLDGSLQQTLQSHDQASSLFELVREQISTGNTVLVFCPTKSQCELTAQQLASVLPPLSSTQENEIQQCLRRYQQRHTTPFDPLISCLLLRGVGVHHAGLTDTERIIVEALFRRRSLNILIATSTLSAGVNLNVDVVIVDGIRRCGQMYSSTEYAQMIGRTGRMGQKKRGTVMVLLDPHDEREFRKRILSETEMERENVSYMRTRWCWCRILLETVALGIETKLNELIELVRHFSYFSYLPNSLSSPSFHFSHSTSCGFSNLFELVPVDTDSLEVRIAGWLSPVLEPHLYELASSLCWLVHHHFLILLPSSSSFPSSLSSSSSSLRCILTELGEASFLSRLNVREVAALAHSLSLLNTHIDMSNSLQIVYHLTPLNAELNISIASALQYIHHYLTDAEVQFADHELLSLNILTALREGQGIESFSADTQNRLKRFLTCLVVNDLLRFNNLEHTKQIFGITKGSLQNIQTAFKVFYHTNLRLLKCLHYDLLYEVFKGFDMHLVTDITPETLELVNLGVVSYL